MRPILTTCAGRVFPLLSALLAFPLSAQPAPATAIHDALVAVVDARTVPGEIVVVRAHGQRVFAEARGEADGMPLRTDTVFWVASMTKPLVAASVMMLVDDGKLRLDDPVANYIPAFKRTRMVRTLQAGSPPLPAFVPSPNGPPHTDPNAPQPRYDLAPAERALTVRDFLTMTAGLQTIGVPNAAVSMPAGQDTLATYVADLAGAPLDFQPGTRWAYSNATGFEVLARIVEVVAAEPYGTFMQRRLFDPLGMKDSHFGVRDDLRARTAPLGMMANSPLSQGRFTSGSAGVWTTAEDYSHFAQMLLDRGRYDGRRLLSSEAVDAMTRNQIGVLSLANVGVSYGGLPDRTNPAIKYGYGMLVIEDAAGAGVAMPRGSYGWDGVGSRRFWVDPKDAVVLVMLAPGGDAATAQRRIENAVVETFGRVKK